MSSVDMPVKQGSLSNATQMTGPGEAPPPLERPINDDYKRPKRYWLLVLVALAMFGLALGLGSCSFKSIEEMRQLERTPEIETAAVISGEVNLRGNVAEYERLLSAPDTGTSTAYYDYHVERRTRDSEGNTRWETVSRDREAVDFELHDDSGSVVVAGSQGAANIDAPRKDRRRSGDRRYTEYRIDPGDEVFVFGYAEELDEGYRIGFEAEGDYYPMISTGSEAGQRHSRTLTSGGLVALAVGSLLFAIFFLLWALGVHNTAVYLVLATLVVGGTLSVQGLMMMVSDLRGADQAATQTVEEGQRVIGDLLEERGIDWDGQWSSLGALDGSEFDALEEDERDRISGVRMMMARSVDRTNANRRRFPEIVIAPLVGVRAQESIAVSEAEQAEIDRLEADHSPVRLSLFFGIPALLVGIIGTWFGTRRGMKIVKLKRTIEHVPTSPTRGAAYGLVELKGKVHPSEGWLEGPLTSRKCVCYRHKVERRKRSGKKKWVLVSDTTETARFWCRDHTGAMEVNPLGADIVFKDKVTRRRGRRRYTEWNIGPEDNLYCLGSATIDTRTHDRLRIESEEGDVPYVLSSMPEDQLMEHKARKGFLALNFGIVATMVAGMGIAGMVVSFGPMLYVVMAGLSCSYLLLILAALYYNDLIFLRDRVDRGWANIDVALKKRFDLVGNLANIVQEFLGHERELQERVVQARNARQGSDGGELDERELKAEGEARDRVIATVESHPEIKGEEVVHKMMRSLREVEDDIAMMRQGYNQTVERYNERIERIPEVFIAQLMRFKEASYLPSVSDKAVEVDMGSGGKGDTL